VFTTRPELVGTHGMVASTHWLASSADMAVLEFGGNAFDAAVAAGLTLQVVEPHLNGPGGEVPIIFHSAERAHTEHFPSSFYPRTAAPGKIVVEERLEPDVIAGLRARGHDLDVVDGWSLGRLSAVSRNTMDGSLRGAANPRGMQGYAVGR
jgi:gamma-glutamyltranspeptidase